MDLYNLPFYCMIAAAFIFLGLQFLGGDHGLDSSQDLSLGHGHEPALSHDLSHDLDHDLSELPLLGFINLGRVPLSLLLMSSCFAWGALGLLLNFGLRNVLSPGWAFSIALGASGLGAIVITRLSSGVLGLLFQEATTAIEPEELIGCVGTVISGQVPSEAESGFGRARIYSSHGTLLQISCLTHPGCQEPAKQTSVLVTGYDPQTRLYTVLEHESEDYIAYLHGHAGEMKRFEQRLQQSLEHLHTLESAQKPQRPEAEQN